MGCCDSKEQNDDILTQGRKANRFQGSSGVPLTIFKFDKLQAAQERLRLEHERSQVAEDKTVDASPTAVERDRESFMTTDEVQLDSEIVQGRKAPIPPRAKKALKRKEERVSEDPLFYMDSDTEEYEPMKDEYIEWSTAKPEQASGLDSPHYC